ncbi:TonB-dependent receptor family protein [Algoriphagus sp. AGSA1]|uniref:TonB-dependent receptor domain-containing protein n=1 Tax=Algoriphagus sp. AGSA1 TaxID=2907213 RepID=UPI001F2F5264|nr:TonB-dependent receptor [Algoriphagus sp. AGSA1]MCE7053866.1 TonB-dependent receptor family protein [Algoriphagus sp. AGSA1]
MLNFWVSAQNSITGKVVDPQNIPLEYAHVLLFQDSLFIQGTVTDSLGKFEIPYSSSDRSYLIQIQAIGFTDFRSAPFFFSGNKDFENILLTLSSTELDEVTVNSYRPLFEQRIDRTVIHVQDRVTNLGSSVLGVLGRSPAVRVNRGINQISMMGKEGVIVMVDNKQLRMESADLIRYLENLNTDLVESIELITAPPASYDAQGGAGIININTLRGEGKIGGQFSGNFAYGKRPKYGINLSLNGTGKKLTYYFNGAYSLARDLELVEIESELNFGNSPIISRLDVERKPATAMYTAESGLEWKISPQTGVGIGLSLLQSNWKMDATALTKSREEEEITSSQTDSYEENLLSQAILNLNLSHSFSDKTRVEIDYDYIRFERDNPTVYQVKETVNQDDEQNSSFLSRAKTPLDIQVGKIDVHNDYAENLSFDLGLKGTHSTFNNQVRVAGKNPEGVWVDIPGFTDSYQLDESLYAVYLSSNWQITDKFRMIAGLRYENYELILESSDQGKVNDRKMNNLFPNLHGSFSFDENNELSLSFVNRIQRPSFSMLAPYFYFFDEHTLFTGNPELVPSLTHQIQLAYQGSKLSTTLQLTKESQPVFDGQPDMDFENKLLVVRPLQGIESQSGTLLISYPVEITTGWTSQYDIRGTIQTQYPIVNSLPVKYASANFEVSTTQIFHVSDWFDAELNAAYFSDYRSGIMYMKERFMLDLGIRKTFSSGIGISFNVNDVLNTGSQWPMTADFPTNDLVYDWLFDAEGTVFRFNLSVPLGSRSVRKLGSRSGSGDEQRRL